MLHRTRLGLFAGCVAGACVGTLSAVPSDAATTHTSWPMTAYDVQHTGANPNETVLGPTDVKSLGQSWRTSVGAVGNQYPYVDTSPVVAAGVQVGSTSVDVLYAGNENGNLVAVDAGTGAVVWQRALGWQIGPSANPSCSSSPFGIADSPVIDRTSNRLYVVDGRTQLWGLDLSTGATAPGYPVSISSPSTTNYDHVWSGLNEVNGRIYIPVASECDAGPYRGRLVVVDAATAAIASTFYVNGPTGATGGGIWGWGGVSFDTTAQHIYPATGRCPGAQSERRIFRLGGASRHLRSAHLGVQRSGHQGRRQRLRLDPCVVPAGRVPRAAGCTEQERELVSLRSGQDRARTRAGASGLGDEGWVLHR